MAWISDVIKQKPSPFTHFVSWPMSLKCVLTSFQDMGRITGALLQKKIKNLDRKEMTQIMFEGMF